MIKLVEVAYFNDHIRCFRDGRIERKFKRKGWKEAKPIITDNGYWKLYICKGKKDMWHRVIWEAFNGKIPDGLTINHKDEIKTNNSLENLELMTRGDNNRYGTRSKRAGETNKANGKLSKPVVGINIKTGEKIEFPSTQEAGRNGFNSGNICSCIKGRIKTYKGYKWHYKDQISLLNPSEV